MYKLNEFEFTASEIAGLLGKTMKGDDITVMTVQNINSPTPNSMLMCYPSNKHLLNEIEQQCLVFCTEDTAIDKPNLSYVITDTPKFDFFDFINDYLLTETSYWVKEVISVSSTNFPEVEFGYNVRVGNNVIIAPGTIIGANCIIGNNVVIRTNVIMGDNCLVKDNAVLGSEGFGYTKRGDSIIHVPQIGQIKVGNSVVIGSNSTIERPALGLTVIKDNVKIDDLVQIGHNQYIGENTIIATGFKGVGGCKIGANCFIGIGVTITSKNVEISDSCLIGAGAIITKSIAENSVVYNKLELHIEENKEKLKNLLGTPLISEVK